MNKSFIPYEIKHGLLADLSNDEFPTQVWGFSTKADDDYELSLPEGTHFGFVFEGTLELSRESQQEELSFDVYKGMYFSSPAKSYLWTSIDCQALIITRLGYKGMFTLGGPIEETGRLRYVSGCTDSLIIPPVMKGDPCLNALYFPAGVEQVPHTHPSMRVGIVISGEGECVTEMETITLQPGMVFVIPANELHWFWTLDKPLVVVAYHPDSDYGPTHEDHPMLNKTIVDGVSASKLERVHTSA